MKENEFQNEAVQSEETASRQNSAEVNPAKNQENTTVNDANNMDTQSEAYFAAMRKLEEEKKAEKKKKKKKRMLIIFIIIAAIIIFSFVKNAVSNSITLNEQSDRVSAAIAAEEYDSEAYRNAANTIDANQTVSDKKKSKAFFNLGKEAVELKNLNCYEDLFNRSIAKEESYKEKVAQYIYEAMSSAENNEEFLDYATYYISLGKALDDTSAAKVKAYLVEAIAVGKFSEYNEKLEASKALGLTTDDEINAKIFDTAMKAYKAKNYAEAYRWFNIYTGKEDIKAAKQESIYEYVIQVLFEDIITDGIDDPRDWAFEILSTDEMKNYKQSEGIRLYCSLADAALAAYRDSKDQNAQDDYVKSKLMFPDSYRFLGKSITSDFYMKLSDEDGKAKICYDCTIAYTALNKYGYTVTDTYNVIHSNSFSLNGSDYILAVKIFNNFSNENMLKYARTGEFTNTKITFEY